MSHSSHAEYFSTLAKHQRDRLRQIQAEVTHRVPGATQCISYNMPAFKQKRTFFYFAAFKHHVGVYPPVMSSRAIIEATSEFRGPKGNLSFPNDQELPLKLIGDVAAALASEYPSGHELEYPRRRTRVA